MTLLDGRKVALEISEEIKGETEKLNRKGIQPRLAVILAGKNEGSLIYLREKEKACKKTGVLFQRFDFPEKTKTETLLKKIRELNQQKEVHGILVQLPLPSSIDPSEVIRSINPQKDVDGFHADNLGKMFLGKEFEELVPCTPLGIIKLLEYYKIPVRGKEATVVGHSNIVGKPISVMLLNRNATVTTCHIDTFDLKKHTLNADILIVAVGKPCLITEDMVKKGAVVIDVGINRLQGKIVGDTDFEKISQKASFITPVPGGVGPLTVACLLLNLIQACKIQQDAQDQQK